MTGKYERQRLRSIVSLRPTATHWNSASNCVCAGYGNCVGAHYMTGDQERRKRDYLTKAVHLPRMLVSGLAPHFPSRRADSATHGPVKRRFRQFADIGSTWTKSLVDLSVWRRLRPIGHPEVI